jgi:hypothetical protein
MVQKTTGAQWIFSPQNIKQVQAAGAITLMDIAASLDAAVGSAFDLLNGIRILAPTSSRDPVGASQPP